MAVTQTQASPTSIIQTDNIGLMVDWTGASPVGTLAVQCCNDYNTQTKTGSWASLDFGSAISISGNSGHHTISINELPYSWLQVVYTPISGAGSLTVSLTTKPIGGG